MEFLGFFITTAIFIVFIGVYILYVTRGKVDVVSKSKGKAATAVDRNLVKNKWVEVGQMMRDGGPAN